MSHSRSISVVVSGLLLVSLVWLPGCGASASRRLLSISVSPAAAAGHDSVSGQVQFTATGNFNAEPVTATLPSVTWTIGRSPFMGIPTPAGVTIDANGI